MTGKHRVFTIALRRDGDGWRGRLKSIRADEVVQAKREDVMRELEMMALAQVIHELRGPDAALVKAVVFEVEEC